MTKQDIKNIIDFEFIGNYTDKEMNRVASAVLKFCNNNETLDTVVNVRAAIDGALQHRNIYDNLYTYLQNNSVIFTYSL